MLAGLVWFVNVMRQGLVAILWDRFWAPGESLYSLRAEEPVAERTKRFNGETQYLTYMSNLVIYLR